MTSQLIAVRLDRAEYGAGPGTVVAIVPDVAAYNRLVTDRDGARDPRMRMWEDADGDAKIGDRVRMRPEDQARTGEKGARI